MNSSEKSLLRKKHEPLELNQGKIGSVSYCKGCVAPGGSLNIKWPCDTIKVLNAIELRPNCEHMDEIDEGWGYISFDYCPLCGEKL